MKVIGIVVEFNPLHNGHIYMINKIKEKYPDSIIIAILDGYFTQRGDISILKKEDKVKYSLDNRIDIVVELPLIYAVQSADIFAYHSIKILNKLHIDTLIFGSESDDIKKLKRIANKQDSKAFQEKVKYFLDDGENYPTAMSLALEEDFDYKPNDLLGISYIKAINKINKNIKVECIQRTIEYYGIEIEDSITSAYNIRNKYYKGEETCIYTPYSKDLVRISYETYFKMIRVKILTDSHLEEYLDVSEGIEFLMRKKIKYICTYADFTRSIKSRRYTYNRISRMLIHILMGIKKDYKEEEYLRILGFNSIGREYLHDNNIEESYKGTEAYSMEITSACIYDMLANLHNVDRTYLYEKRNNPIKK